MAVFAATKVNNVAHYFMHVPNPCTVFFTKIGDNEAAIEALKSPGIREKLNITKTAKQYGVNRTTLSRGYLVQGIRIR